MASQHRRRPRPGSTGGGAFGPIHVTDGRHPSHQQQQQTLRRRPSSGSSALRRVTRASKKSFMVGKRRIWDTNDATLLAAESAVDHWEHCYRGLRSLLLTATRSAQSMYGTAKTVVSTTEHHLLLPVRDCVLLPAFALTEEAVVSTAGFLQSEEAERWAGKGLEMVRGTPFVGESILAPALLSSVDLLQTVWHVAQYPIPSKEAVRTSVDWLMTGTKSNLRYLGHEISFCAKLIDANVTRTMTHTQWRVLGSGPYSSLGMENKQAVLDHLCERYLSLGSEVHRYELAAHVRAQNRSLYCDLVLNGLLLSRAGEEMRRSDAWLHVALGDGNSSGSASSRYGYEYAYGGAGGEDWLLFSSSSSVEEKGENTYVNDDGSMERVVPLWFHLPYVNGDRPGRDAPWVRFAETDRVRLEGRFLEELDRLRSGPNFDSDSLPDLHVVDSAASFVTGAAFEEEEEELSVESAHPPLMEYGTAAHDGDDDDDDQSHHTAHTDAALPSRFQYPTIAKWYTPDLARDLLVDQKRHAVSFLPCCPVCGEEYEREDESFHLPPLATRSQSREDAVCQHCSSHGYEDDVRLTNTAIPPMAMVMRPLLWRFHGPHTSEVRRGVWMLDTSNGLQPYNDESCAILEDAYRFLRRHLAQKASDKRDVLLTVQVSSPDGGEAQLVQFRSLTQITAIQKTLGGALSLFNKKRVYRGATVVDEDASAQAARQEEIFGRKSPSLRASVSQETFDMGRISPSTEETGEDGLLTPPTLFESEVSADGQGKSLGRSPALSVAAPPKVESARRARETPGETDDEVQHLILVVHGIGEMLRSVDLFGMALPQLSTISDCCDWLRKNHSSVHAAQFADLQEVNPNASFTRDDVARATLGRVEYLPIEWHEPFAIQSKRHESSEGDEPKCTTLKDVSLKTIPALRQFTNDTMLDILYFMSPAHHDAIIDIVTSEANLVVSKFLNLTGIDHKTLKVSIIGHSLGSIISWDILSHQVSPRGSKHITPRSKNVEDRPEFISPRMEWIEGGPNTPERAKLQNAASQPSYPQLNFEVSNFFMLGSPVAVFLMLRNQHRPLCDSFSLPGCKRVFNIFHPYDPVSYRIEPLLDPHNADIEPKLISHWKGGFRVQYQTKFMLRKFFNETRRTQKNMIEAVEKGMADIGLLDTTYDDVMDDEDDEGIESSSLSSSDGNYQVVQCGSLNQGRRIDFMLQEKEIENANEYVFALSAHSSYWTQKDLSLFVARQIFRSRDHSVATLQSGHNDFGAFDNVPQVNRFTNSM